MERYSGWRLWRAVGLVQLSPRLPPLVQGRVAYSGALVPPEKLYTRLEQTVSPLWVFFA